MFEKRLIYRDRGVPEEDVQSYEAPKYVENKNTPRSIDFPEVPKVTDATHSSVLSVMSNDYESNFATAKASPNKEAITANNVPTDTTELQNDKVAEAGSKNTEIPNPTEGKVEGEKESAEKNADKTAEIALVAALNEKGVETSEIEKRIKINELKEARNERINGRVNALSEKPLPRILLQQSDLRDLFTAFRVRNSKGEVKYPFEGLKVSQFIGQKPVDLAFRLLGLKDQLPKYLILAKLNITKVVGVPIDQKKLEEAKRMLSVFENSKSEKEIDDAVYQASINNEKKLLDYKKQIGEMSGSEYRKEYKKLLDKVRRLGENGIKINFSQNAFISSMLARPSFSFFANKAENSKNIIVNKWQTFWKTRELRRGMLWKGIKNAVMFPPRYALKIPAYMVGYNYFTNKIRKKHNLSPITISSDLRKDFAKWGKGLEAYKKASEQAKTYIGEAKIDERIKDNESEILANIENGLPPPVSVDENLFNGI